MKKLLSLMLVVMTVSVSAFADGFQDKSLGAVSAVERSFTIDLDACKAVWGGNPDYSSGCGIKVNKSFDPTEIVSFTDSKSVSLTDKTGTANLKISANASGYAIEVMTINRPFDSSFEAVKPQIEKLVNEMGGKVSVYLHAVQK